MVVGHALPVLVQTVAPSTTTTTATLAVLTSAQGRGRQPNPIPVVTLDDDNSELNLTIAMMPPDKRSPTIVPEKKAQVGASPAMVKGIMAAGAEIGLDVIKDAQAEAAKKAYVKETLGSVSSDELDSPDTSAVKSQKKWKSRKECGQHKSKAQVSSSSDSEGRASPGESSVAVQEICSSLDHNTVVQNIHTDAQEADQPFIKEIHLKHGLPNPGITQDDMTGFLPYIEQYRATQLADPRLLTYHIWTLDEAMEAMHRNLAKPKMEENKLIHRQWKNAIRQLTDFRDMTPLPET